MSALDTAITNASSSFSTLTGFSYGDVVSWTTDRVVELLGAGLGFVQEVLPLVVAIVLITVVIRMVYHGLRWLHILK